MTTVAERLNIGIIGAGFAATAVHIPYLKGLPTANVLAIADSTPGRAAAAAARYGIPLHTDNYRMLLDNEDVRVVDICTPPQSHAQVAIEAVAAGKDVIVEKPLTLNLAEFASLSTALTQATGPHLGVVLNLRYMPLVHSIIEVLHSGRLGKICGVSATIHTAPPKVEWLSDPALSRYGLLYDYLPHIVDLVLWGLQAYPTSVHCVASRPEGSGFHMIVGLRSPLTGDCSMLVDVAWTSATSIRSFQVWGTAQDLFVDLQDQFWYVAHGHLDPRKRAAEFARRMVALGKRAAGGRAAIKYGAMVHHRSLLSDFVAALASRQCPRISMRDGLLHVAVIDAAVRSHMENRTVAVPAEPFLST